MKYNRTFFLHRSIIVLFYYCTEGPVVVLSKQQLVTEINRAHLRLEEKVKVSNYSILNPKKSCREMTTEFQLSKAAF